MENKNMLKCTDCGHDLKLSVAYDGCDWNSEKGEGSGFDYEIYFTCVSCGSVYPIGRLQHGYDFCENIETNRPYKSI